MSENKCVRKSIWVDGSEFDIRVVENTADETICDRLRVVDVGTDISDLLSVHAWDKIWKAYREGPSE